MLDEKARKSLEAINYVTRASLNKDDFNLGDLDNLLACLPGLLQRQGFTRRFIGWLGRMTLLPDVLKEAGKWAWALRQFSKVVSKW